MILMNMSSVQMQRPVIESGHDDARINRLRLAQTLAATLLRDRPALRLKSAHGRTRKAGQLDECPIETGARQKPVEKNRWPWSGPFVTTLAQGRASRTTACS